jgi:hypothetical protein
MFALKKGCPVVGPVFGHVRLGGTLVLRQNLVLARVITSGIGDSTATSSLGKAKICKKIWE